MSDKTVENQKCGEPAIACIDYCGIIVLLRKLLACDILTQRETENIARRIAADMGVDMIISL